MLKNIRQLYWFTRFTKLNANGKPINRPTPTNTSSNYATAQYHGHAL